MNLVIENFKCFSEPTTVEFGSITANVGMNSVGKSSVSQAILLLRQAIELIKNKEAFATKTDIIVNLNDTFGLQLGDSGQIFSSSNKNYISLVVDESIEFVFEEAEDRLTLVLKKPPAIKNVNDSIFAPTFHYMNAERVGPRNYQTLAAQSQLSCGFYGENTFQAVQELMRSRYEVSKVRAFPQNPITAIDKQIEYWMDYIVPGVNIKINPQETLRLVQLQIQQPALDTGFGSPYNYGFGISYVLPIIVSGLMASENSTLIIENPEAHLHPSGQSRIGEFLTQVALDNVNVIIETHSEHVINGIRLAALKKKMEPSSIGINYFTLDSETGKNQVDRIPLNDRMDILEWPKGFFDQEENDLRELRILRSGERNEHKKHN